MSNATATSPALPVADSLNAVGAALEQLALVGRELFVAVWQEAAGVGQILSKQASGLIVGIAIGLLAAALVWLAIRTVPRPHTAELPQSARQGVATAPKAKSDLQSLPMDQVEKQLDSTPDGLAQARSREAAHALRPERNRR